MKKRPEVVRQGNLLRSSRWNGVRAGDSVAVNGVRGRQSWVFVAHVLNEATGDQWVEVRGGRTGEAKGRSFRPELIFPASAKRGLRLVGMSLADAPQLPIA
jgi:hypothetical protein